MDDTDRFRRRYAIAQNDFAIRRTRGVGQPLELQAGEDVCQAPIAVLLDLASVEEIETRRQDDIADLDGDIFILLGKIDRPGWAEFLTGFARAFLEVRAVLAIDDREFWHCLGEGCVNDFAVTQSSFVHFVYDFLWAFFLADAAACA